MIRLLADENILGLDRLPASEVSVRVKPGRQITRADLDAVDALWVRSVTPVDADLIYDAPLKFVGSATAGYEHVDAGFLERRGIPFFSAPGSNANAVVEYVIAAILSLEEHWSRLEKGGLLGIVGFGHVGQRLAEVANALGWRWLAYDPWKFQPTVAGESVPGATTHPAATFDQVLDADVISVHCSLTDEQPWPSRHLFTGSEFDRLGSHQLIINAARGEVFDWLALSERLARAECPKLVLDVWNSEPDIDTSLLTHSAIAVATPHIAGYSVDAKLKATAMLWDRMAEIGLARGRLGSPAAQQIAKRSSVGSGPGTSPSGRQASQDLEAFYTSADVMSSVYSIAQDDAALRSAMRPETSSDECDRILKADSGLRKDSQQETNPGERFDRLRKNYLMRRELAAVQIADVALKTDEARRFYKAVSQSATMV
ncbi:MAG: 4-phosphoerythronate dehydrogenase [Pseudomonadota bacterium]